MTNFAILYLSKPAQVITSEDLLQIEKISQRKNAESGVHGYLYFNGKYFLQYLEGSASNLDEVYDRIHKDERHTIELFSKRAIQQLKFKEWSMKLLSRGKEGLISIEDLIIKIISQMHYHTENGKLNQEEEDKMWQMIDKVAENKMDYV